MSDHQADRVSTGIPGLDSVLQGGFIPRRGYMATGEPGSGKTILGFHYLAAGIAAGESALYVNLEETTEDIRANAAAVGQDLSDVAFLDLSPGSETFTENSADYQVFEPDEVDTPAVTERIVDRVRDVAPDRVFVDPLSRFRYLTSNDYQFRRQVGGFMRFLHSEGASVLFTSQATPDQPDDDLQYLSDGTIRLGQTDGRRWLAVPKFRGSRTDSGRHAVRISDAGMDVYPVLTPGDHSREFESGQLPSGVPEIDQMLHGGLERGTITMLSGPSGVGKTTLGTQFVKEAAGRGERSVVYMFEESTRTLRERCRAVNIPVDEMTEQGTLAVEEVEPLEQSPEEFAAAVREEVEERDARFVMLDGIDGYRLSLQGEEAELQRNLNALGRYLKEMGVTAVFVDATDSVTGEFRPTSSGVSYLADTIVFLRYLEVGGELHKAIGILKQRTSDFERSLRQFAITEYGISVGEPLSELRGILSGSPEFARTDRSREDRGG